MLKKECQRAKAAVPYYWFVHPLMRERVYGWLENHAFVCDACALRLENEAQRLQEETRKRTARAAKKMKDKKKK